jgi:hypothetical protein
MRAVEHDPMRVISPELVLVDEELAAWCRLRLCEEAAAENAKRADRSSVPPSTVLEFSRPAAYDRPVRETSSWWIFLRRESVLVTAAVLLFGIAGAQSRPEIGTLRVPSPPPAEPGVVITWPRVPMARWYTVRVRLGSRTVFWAKHLTQNRLLLPPSSVYGGRSFGYRTEVHAVLDGRLAPVQATERRSQESGSELPN